MRVTFSTNSKFTTDRAVLNISVYRANVLDVHHVNKVKAHVGHYTYSVFDTSLLRSTTWCALARHKRQRWHLLCADTAVLQGEQRFISYLGVLRDIVESRDVQAELSRLGELPEARAQRQQRVTADASRLPH